MLLQNDEESNQVKRWPGLCGVALYKGAVVSINEITYPRKIKELTRSAKMEMKIMRQLHHDNVNSFRGIQFDVYKTYYSGTTDRLTIVRGMVLPFGHSNISVF